MSKIKKLFTLILSFSMFLVSSFAFTACTTEELTKNTEVETETVIETITSIIPVELNKSTAQGIYSIALQKLVFSKAFECNISFISANMYATETIIGALNSENQRILYINFIASDNSNTVICKGLYDGKFCELDLIEKIYRERPDYYMKIFGGELDDILNGAKDNIVSGRYYNGYYYVSVQVEEGNNVVYYEFVIKDNMLVQIHATSFIDSIVDVCGQFTFNYENVDTSKVVMSLDGYTKV